MNICLLNDSFPPVIDGVANVVLNYADHLMQDHGAQVVVGTPEYPDTDYSAYPYKVIPYKSYDTTKAASGYRAGNPLDSRSVALLAKEKPDIIHTHCPAASTILARLLREETGAPVIFTYHTKYDIDIERIVKIKPLAEESIRVMVSNIEACDDVWVVSQGAGDNLKSLGYQGDVHVMNNGVDFAKGRVPETQVAEVTKGYDLPDGVPVFLFVGRMMTYKGLPLILDALKILADAGRDFRMVFIGKGPDQGLLQNQAKELGLMGTADADKVIFTGPVYDRDALRAWNTRADLFLFPSTFDTNGLVVREAAACGLASVLVRGSCAAEGITDGRNGLIMEENAESLAQVLLQVSGDLSYLHALGQHAMDEIYLSWESCVNTAYDRYQLVLEKKREGALQSHHKLPADYLISAAARRIEEEDKLLSMGEEFFHNLRQAAVGMMENFHEQ